MLILNDLIKPNYIMTGSNGVEVINHFKLLGCIIDDRLTFAKHVDILVKTVNQKLFTIKNIFFLPYKIKLHFFKTFILPHFDYCTSLFIYFSKTLLEKIRRVYNSCLFNLLKVDLHDRSIDQQILLLAPLNLFAFLLSFVLPSFFVRVCLTVFLYKILNGQILPAIKNDLLPICANLRHFGDIRNIYVEPFSKIKKHSKRISSFLLKF